MPLNRRPDLGKPRTLLNRRLLENIIEGTVYNFRGPSTRKIGGSIALRKDAPTQLSPIFAKITAISDDYLTCDIYIADGATTVSGRQVAVAKPKAFRGQSIHPSYAVGDIIRAIPGDTGVADANGKPIHLEDINADGRISILLPLSIMWNGRGAVVETGQNSQVLWRAPWNCEIEEVYLGADQAGSVAVDIWKSTSTVPTDANSITGGAEPALVSVQENTITTFTDWTTTSITDGDRVVFNVDSATTVEWVAMSLELRLT